MEDLEMSPDQIGMIVTTLVVAIFVFGYVLERLGSAIAAIVYAVGSFLALIFFGSNPSNFWLRNGSFLLGFLGGLGSLAVAYKTGYKRAKTEAE